MATATKALQDQLADNDLPRVAAAVGGDFSFAVLKGRSTTCAGSGVRGRRPGEQMTLQPGSADPPDADDPLTPTAAGAATRRCPTTRSRWAGSATRSAVWCGGPRTPPPGPLRARVRASLPGVVHGLDHRPRAPGGVSVPVRPGVLRRGARLGRPRPTWWSSAPTCTGPTWPWGRRVRRPGGGVRRGPRGGGGDDRQPRRGDRSRSLPGPGRIHPAAARPGLVRELDTAEAVAAVGDLLHRGLRPLVGRCVTHPPWSGPGVRPGPT